MARQTKPTQPQPTTTSAPAPTGPANLREQLLADFATLRVPLTAAQLDAMMARAERGGLSHLEFAQALLGEQARQRRERAIAARIREAKFDELHTLAGFDWEFNAKAINRAQIEDLATAAFIGRRDNLVLVGQSGVGKSRIVQALGQAACVVGYRVRYTTSADLLSDLTARLADRTWPRRVRYYARFDWLIIDEFAFDKIERSESPQASNLLFKIVQARGRNRLSTTVATNVDFDSWAKYLEDPNLAQAVMDRVVDNAIILKINGKSYRAYRAQMKKTTASE